MPFPVKKLIENQDSLLTVKKDESVIVAFSKMIERNFSQLPVIDENNKLWGMVTYESILKGTKHFGTTLDKLLVQDVMIDAPRFTPEDDLFDLLDQMKNTNAVLILDFSDRLTGIVTSYDTTMFFRAHTEDLMHVEDIEMMIKYFIKTSCTNEAEEIDEEKLSNIIKKVFPKNKPEEFEKTFDQLTLSEYIRLLLSNEIWNVVEPIMNIQKDSLRNLLENVRKTRNTLAHFRSAISPNQQDELLFCENWMSMRQAEWENIRQKVTPLEIDVNSEPIEIFPSLKLTENSIPSNESAQQDTTNQNNSRYSPLADFLYNQPGNNEHVVISFDEIEALIGNSLPNSARSHRAWWANDSTSHPQSKNWLEAGWRTSYINMTEERVVFIRIKEREKAYIEFFSSVLSELSNNNEFPLKKVSPDGTSWLVVANYPKNAPTLAYFAFSFTRDKRFRVELYIDVADQEKNKMIFDLFEIKKSKYEEILGPLSWERLDKRRASRIAICHSGQITDNPTELKELCHWAVQSLRKFYKTLSPDLEIILDKVMGS